MVIQALLLILLLLILYELTARPQNFPPGPVNLPLLGYVPFLGNRPCITLKKLSEKYGDILSVNFLYKKMVVLNSYDSIRDAFNEESFSGRPDLYFSFAITDGYHGIVFNEGAQWQELRRFVLRVLRDFGFGKSSLETIINDEIVELISDLKKDVGRPVEIRNRFNLSIINALWTITSGERFKHDDPKMKQFFRLFSLDLVAINFSGLSSVLPYSKYIPAKLVGADKLLTHLNIAKSIIRDLIKRQAEMFSKDCRDTNFIQTYLRKADETKNDPQSCFRGEDGNKNLEIVLLDLFVAGSETTSTVLTWLVLLLSTHGDIQSKVHDEIDRVIGRNRTPSMEDKCEMPYLEAVLLETLRYSTVIPQGLIHKTTKDTVFRGYGIPKGTWVMSNLYAVHRSEKIWERPYEFYPKHFLTQNGQLKNVEQLIPFSIGKRVCLGERLAKMELFLFATGLLQSFTFMQSESEPKPTLELQPGLISQPHPFKVVIRQRISKLPSSAELS